MNSSIGAVSQPVRRLQDPAAEPGAAGRTRPRQSRPHLHGFGRLRPEGSQKAHLRSDSARASRLGGYQTRGTMRTHSTRRRTIAGVGLASTALVLGTTFAAGSAATAAGADHGDIVYTLHPLTRQFSTGTKPGALPTPSQCVAAIGLACYTPALIRKAYDIPDGWTGKGQRIVVVDAYGSPTARQDLDVFSQTFGLPKADLNIYYPGGSPQTSTAHKGQPLGWAGETSLDLQWAHAIAPDATINLV